MIETVDACAKSQQTRFIDYTENGLNSEIIKKFETRLKKCNQLGVNAKFYLTDTKTSDKYSGSINELIANTKEDEIIQWYELSEDGNFVVLKHFSVGTEAVKIGSGDKAGYNFSKSALAMLNYVKENGSTASAMELNLAFGIDYLELLADIAKEFKIAPKYWNPDLGEEYNPVFFRIWQIAFLQFSLTDS
ncbi:MAG: hypothetical protein HC831_07035, partial [Chloroflexia bacterium]|nr:hypothetical protein [Chloroflexia bacterium]